ncbi:MAG: hypothetical protein QM775_22395 [Pirellulales bacterium]
MPMDFAMCRLSEAAGGAGGRYLAEEPELRQVQNSNAGVGFDGFPVNPAAFERFSEQRRTPIIDRERIHEAAFFRKKTP